MFIRSSRIDNGTDTVLKCCLTALALLNFFLNCIQVDKAKQLMGQASVKSRFWSYDGSICLQPQSSSSCLYLRSYGFNIWIFEGKAIKQKYKILKNVFPDSKLYTYAFNCKKVIQRRISRAPCYQHRWWRKVELHCQQETEPMAWISGLPIRSLLRHSPLPPYT